MNYYLDTEFLEGVQPSWFGKNKPTIDLISIGIVSEDGREFYAISKEFNLKDAWNRWQPRTGQGDRNNTEPREYWLRENVLKPIIAELDNIERGSESSVHSIDFKKAKRLIEKYGQTNKEIAEGIKQFIRDCEYPMAESSKQKAFVLMGKINPKFYAYYADYDWVVFCWLFGKMIDLPKGFPMYCRDLKQIADDIWEKTGKDTKYPKGANTHNALADAKWNKEFHGFLQHINEQPPLIP